MQHEPLVTAVIIFLNTEPYLQEAIESVLKQTYENWELMLVNDGSTDRSTAIAQQYAAQYPNKIRYLEHAGHQNRGMSASRNLGIRSGAGEYIALLDSDDVWLPRKLEDQVALLNAQPEAAMLYGRTQFWHSWTGNPEDFKADRYTDLGLEPNCLVQPPELLTLFLKKEDSIASTCSILLRRSAYEQFGGFEENFRDMYEDMVFYTKLYLEAPVFVTDGCWDRYRQHSKGCNAIATKEGRFSPTRPNKSRETFLIWIETYLSKQGYEGTEVWNVLQKELWPYRHPVAYRLTRFPQSIKSRTRQLLGAVTRRTLPLSTRRWLHERRKGRRTLPIMGWGIFPGFRTVEPICRDFGCARGVPVDRYYMGQFLEKQSASIQGRVLEIAENFLTRRYGGEKVTQSDVLHVAENNPYATIVGDLTNADHIPSDTFDCIILTQTLQFIYDVPAAIQTLYRILKPGGVLLATFSGISQISPPDMEKWGQYWNFTTLSARKLFTEKFPATHVEVKSHGNVLVATAFLQGIVLEDLRKEELDYHDPEYEVLITVKATKPAVQL
jgi:glycosyltransferase involved in cell wall biosynthesis